MYKKIDWKFYKEVELNDLTKEDLIEMLKELKNNNPVFIPYTNPPPYEFTCTPSMNCGSSVTTNNS